MANEKMSARRPFHLTYADVKLCDGYISVLFNSVEEIDHLIAGLATLKDETDDFGHCHLLDYDHTTPAKKGERKKSTEVYFCSPFTSEEEKALRRRLFENP